MLGYPAEEPFDGTQLRRCTTPATTVPYVDIVAMPCQITGGSSGGPWLADFNAAPGWARHRGGRVRSTDYPDLVGAARSARSRPTCSTPPTPAPPTTPTRTRTRARARARARARTARTTGADNPRPQHRPQHRPQRRPGPLSRPPVHADPADGFPGHLHRRRDAPRLAPPTTTHAPPSIPQVPRSPHHTDPDHRPVDHAHGVGGVLAGGNLHRAADPNLPDPHHTLSTHSVSAASPGPALSRPRFSDAPRPAAPMVRTVSRAEGRS